MKITWLEGLKQKLVTISSKIKKYVEYFYNKSNCKYLITFDNKEINYDTYEGRFNNLMKSLNLKHLPEIQEHLLQQSVLN